MSFVMERLDVLQEQLARLPGIGPRQARRLGFYLLQTSQEQINVLFESINAARETRFHCATCNRLFFLSNTHRDNTVCQTCSDETRDTTAIMLVARQADFEQIERSGVWSGRYFILGKLVRLADKNPLESLPLALFRQQVERFDVEELVIALPINPEGENTSYIVCDYLRGLGTVNNLAISHLARGLSAGSELEYSDPLTIEQAITNRK